jgi:PAS domain S-box-containing protein
MPTPLRVLILEDREADAELMVHALRQAGFAPHWQRVETEVDYLACLQANLDVILADYAVGQFDALQALALLQKHGLDIPCIVVTGAVSEEAAVACMKRGAADYLLKDRLARLGPAVVQALAQKHLRSERLQAEEALRQSEANFRLLFAANPHAMWVYDVQTLRFLEVNEAAVVHYGYSRDAFLRMRITDIRPPEDIPRLLEYVRKGRPPLQYSGQWRHRLHNGCIIDVDITSHTLEFGRRCAVLVVAQDITERLRAEAALQQKDEELRAMSQQLWQAAKLATMGELAASIAHELNNPLATVSLRVEALLAHTPPGGPAQRPLAVIAQEVARMGSLVANLLHFSRHSQPQISSLDVREEVDDTLILIQSHLHNHRIGVMREFAPEVPLVHADRQQMRQVFLNLLTNASDAMPQGGTLTLRVGVGMLAAGTPAVVLECTDSGVGIAPEHLERVGEPFFTTKGESKGTGLGMAICRRIIREHSGTLELASELGQGTTVRVLLPVPNEANGAKWREGGAE